MAGNEEWFQRSPNALLVGYESLSDRHGVVGVGLACGLMGLFSVRRMDGLMQQLNADHLKSVRAAGDLEAALLEERGYVASYILDSGNSRWLEELEQRKTAFTGGLEQARRWAATSQERDILLRLEQAHDRYNEARDRAIAFEQEGDSEMPAARPWAGA